MLGASGLKIKRGKIQAYKKGGRNSISGIADISMFKSIDSFNDFKFVFSCRS